MLPVRQVALSPCEGQSRSPPHPSRPTSHTAVSLLLNRTRALHAGQSDPSPLACCRPLCRLPFHVVFVLPTGSHHRLAADADPCFIPGQPGVKRDQGEAHPGPHQTLDAISRDDKRRHKLALDAFVAGASELIVYADAAMGRRALRKVASGQIRLCAAYLCLSATAGLPREVQPKSFAPRNSARSADQYPDAGIFCRGDCVPARGLSRCS